MKAHNPQVRCCCEFQYQWELPVYGKPHIQTEGLAKYLSVLTDICVCKQTALSLSKIIKRNNFYIIKKKIPVGPIIFPLE